MDTEKICVRSDKGARALRKGSGLSSQELLVLVFVNGKNKNATIIEQLASRISVTEIVGCLESLEVKGFIVDREVDISSSQSANQLPLGNQLNNEIKKLIEVEITEFIGPMAKIVCADVWKKTNELETALQLLSVNLPRDKVDAFKFNVIQKSLDI